MQIIPNVPYMPADDLETAANALLASYECEFGPLATPPVPVEAIADFHLHIGIVWEPIPEDEGEVVLACITAGETPLITFNESRRSHFDTYLGPYEFTLAHELGHFRLHLSGAASRQLAFDFGRHRAFLCRAMTSDRREHQANQFASCLMMPSRLLLPALDQMDLNWPNLYRLRDAFRVSITALRIRLEGLGRLYIDPNKRLYRSRAEANGQARLL